MKARLERHESAQALLDTSSEFLSRDEAENQLGLGIAANIVRDPSRYEQRVWLASVRDDDANGAVIAVAVKTSPYQPVLTRAPSVAIDAIVDDLSALVAEDGLASVPGVHAPDETAALFAERWCKRHELSRSITLHLRAHRLDRVIEPRWARGALRLATDADFDLLARFLVAFHDEAVPHGPMDDGPTMARRALATGGMYLWDDDVPVCLVGAMTSTPNGTRIGPVYTPKELRGRGYASSCVAAVSKRVLDSGKRFCFLYTDLANDTSNKIYAQVGYQPLTDFTEWKFSTP